MCILSSELQSTAEKQAKICPHSLRLTVNNIYQIYTVEVQWKCSKIPMNKAVKTAKNIDEELARSKCFLFELWKYHLTFRKSLNLIGCEKTRLRFKLISYIGVAYCELYFQYNCSSAWLKAKSSGSTLDIGTQ